MLFLQSSNNHSSTLGVLSGSTMRLVTLRGRADFNQTFGDAEGLNDEVWNWLKSDGFDVVSVNVTKETLFTNNLLIEIQCNVLNQYPDEQVRQRAIQVLSNLTRWWFGEYHPLVNVSMQIVGSSNYSNSGSNNNQSSGNSGSNNNQSSGNSSGGNYQPNNQTYVDPTKETDTWFDKFLKDLGGNLGISTPVAVVGGGLILFILLKRSI